MGARAHARSSGRGGGRPGRAQGRWPGLFGYAITKRAAGPSGNGALGRLGRHRPGTDAARARRGRLPTVDAIHAVILSRVRVPKTRRSATAPTESRAGSRASPTHSGTGGG